MGLSSWKENVMKVIAEPERFFTEMKTHGGFSEPLQFLILNSIIMALIASSAVILTFYLRGTIIGSAFVLFMLLAVVSGVVSSLILPFLGAGLLFYITSHFGGRSTYEATYRIIAYLSAFYSFLPFVTQFSRFRSLTRLKCAVLLVTSIPSFARAILAIRISMSSIILPASLNRAFILP